MPQQPSRGELYGRFEEQMVQRIGSFAKPVVYQTKYHHACPVCGGPKLQDSPICYSCQRLAEQAQRQGVSNLLADRVRISHYAIKFDQMYRIVAGYKRDSPESVEYRETLKYVLGDALAIHYPCIAKVSDGHEPTSWVTVPSTTNGMHHGRPHPLHQLVEPMLGRAIPEIELVAHGEKTRRIVPDTFSLAGEYNPSSLRHVLVIDDTWTSGTTVQSAAIMLKQQGAQRVTIYCLARVIDLDYCRQQVGRGIAHGYEHMEYRKLCPWMLNNHSLQ